MRSIARLIVFVAAIALVPVAAGADPWDRGHGKGLGEYKVEEKYNPRTGEYKYEEKGPGYRYECRVDRHGYRLEDRVFRVGDHRGPPPWAPAHGYRRKHEGPPRRETVYVPSFDIDIGRCNRDLIGAVIGGATGGLLGSQIGDGDGQLAATAAGTFFGALFGGAIGRAMDQVDRYCVGQVLEHAPDGRQIVWTSGDSRYAVVPVEAFRSESGRYCREYQSTATINGQ